MKLNEDIGELSGRGQVVLLGALALCCVVPMVVLVGVVSVSGAVFGATAMVVVAAIAVVAWGALMGRHHRSMHADQTDDQTTTSAS